MEGVEDHLGQDFPPFVQESLEGALIHAENECEGGPGDERDYSETEHVDDEMLGTDPADRAVVGQFVELPGESRPYAGRDWCRLDPC
jgi:hypothetical protein